MVDEIKQEKTSRQVGPLLVKVILGLFFLVLGTGAIIALWEDLFTLIKGCIGPFLVLAGIITLALAKE